MARQTYVPGAMILMMPVSSLIRIRLLCGHCVYTQASEEAEPSSASWCGDCEMRLWWGSMGKDVWGNAWAIFQALYLSVID